METLSDWENGPNWSMPHAVLWTSARSISACVCSSTSGNWIAWLLASGLPNGAQAGRGLADAVLVEEMLHHRQAAALTAQDRGLRDPHVGERDVPVVGRHVERPEVLLDLEPGCVDRDEERGDALAAAGRPAGPGEDQVVGGGVHAGVPGLLAVDHPVAPPASPFPLHPHRAGLHERRVAAVLGLGDAEREPASPGGEVV